MSGYGVSQNSHCKPNFQQIQSFMYTGTWVFREGLWLQFFRVLKRGQENWSQICRTKDLGMKILWWGLSKMIVIVRVKICTWSDYLKPRFGWFDTHICHIQFWIALFWAWTYNSEMVLTVQLGDKCMLLSLFGQQITLVFLSNKPSISSLPSYFPK